MSLVDLFNGTQKKHQTVELVRPRAKKGWRKAPSKLIDAGMREKGINNMEWFDRKEWRRKIKLKFEGQKDMQTSRICTYVNKRKTSQNT